MFINSIQNDIKPYTTKHNNGSSCVSQPVDAVLKDSFTKSVSFKAAIHDYAKKGDWEGIKRELDKGVDINSKDESGNTPLGLACYYGNLLAARYLLDQDDIDVNAFNNNNRTAIQMMLSSYLINDALYDLLLDRKDIDLTIQNDGWKIPLDAAQTGSFRTRSWYYKLEEKTKYQLAHPETIGNRLNVRKLPVDISKLSPEENIWTKEEISKAFLKLVENADYEDAATMLRNTPLIDLASDNNDILIKVCSTGKPDFVEKVFDYKRNQGQMQEEYETKRKDFLERTIGNLAYEKLTKNNVALNTVDGFRVLMANAAFNPNDIVGEKKISLFEQACRIDPLGYLAEEILSKYGDEFTANAAKIKNPVLKGMIDAYEQTGKYKLILNKIKDNAFYENKRDIAAAQLNDLLQSTEFSPGIVDEGGNTVLHIAATLPHDMGRTLIQMALDKGVDINAGNVVGQKPLMSAIKKLIITDDNAGKMNLMSNIKFLLDKGADINAQDNNGQTAFHFACIGSIAALLTLLLSHKPNVFLEDKYGNRAAKYLKTEEVKEIYEKYLRG